MTIEDKCNAILDYCTGRHTERCIVHGKDCKLLNVCKGALGFNNSDVSCKCIDIKNKVYTDTIVEYLYSLIHADSDTSTISDMTPEMVLDSVYEDICSISRKINSIDHELTPIISQMNYLQYEMQRLEEKRTAMERWYYSHGGSNVNLD